MAHLIAIRTRPLWRIKWPASPQFVQKNAQTDSSHKGVGVGGLMVVGGGVRWVGVVVGVGMGWGRVGWGEGWGSWCWKIFHVITPSSMDIILSNPIDNRDNKDMVLHNVHQIWCHIRKRFLKSLANYSHLWINLKKNDRVIKCYSNPSMRKLGNDCAAAVCLNVCIHVI